MSEDNALVLVAGYQDLDSARHDFQTLVDAAKDKSIPLQGAVLIGKDAEANSAGENRPIARPTPAPHAAPRPEHWPAPSPTIGSRPGWPTRSAKRWRRAEQWSSP